MRTKLLKKLRSQANKQYIVIPKDWDDKVSFVVASFNKHYSEYFDGFLGEYHTREDACRRCDSLRRGWILNKVEELRAKKRLPLKYRILKH